MRRTESITKMENWEHIIPCDQKALAAPFLKGAYSPDLHTAQVVNHRVQILSPHGSLWMWLRLFLTKLVPLKIFDLSIHDTVLFLEVSVEVSLADIAFSVDALAAEFWAGIEGFVVFFLQVFGKVWHPFETWFRLESPRKKFLSVIPVVWVTVSVVAWTTVFSGWFLNFHAMISSKMLIQVVLALETVRTAVFLAILARVSCRASRVSDPMAFEDIETRECRRAFVE